MIKRRYAIIVDIVFAAMLPILWGLSNLMLLDRTFCVFRKSGYLCPACGGTRCVYYFMRLDFVSSFLANPYLFISAIAAAVLLFVYNVYILSKGKYLSKTYKVLFNPYYLIIWTVGFTVFGVLRNFL